MPATAASRAARSPPWSIASNVGSTSRAPPPAAPARRRIASARTASERSSTAARTISTRGEAARLAGRRTASAGRAHRLQADRFVAVARRLLEDPPQLGLHRRGDDRLPLGDVPLDQRPLERALGFGPAPTAGEPTPAAIAASVGEGTLGRRADLAVRIAHQLEQRGEHQLGGRARRRRRSPAPRRSARPAAPTRSARPPSAPRLWDRRPPRRRGRRPRPCAPRRDRRGRRCASRATRRRRSSWRARRTRWLPPGASPRRDP